MKNLLLNAVEELIIKADKEIDDARNDIKVMEHKGAKLNRVYDAHGYIINLIDRINVLKDKLAIDFPEEEEAIEKINKKVRIILIQIEDVLNMAYEVGNEILDDENYDDEIF